MTVGVSRWTKFKENWFPRNNFFILKSKIIQIVIGTNKNLNKNKYQNEFFKINKREKILHLQLYIKRLKSSLKS
jgi:hypothetical protein